MIGKPSSKPSGGVPTGHPSTPTATAPTGLLAYPSEVQYGVAVSNLIQSGCSLCYNKFYGDRTTTSIIESCTGKWLFVGAVASDSSTFLLGAYGLASDVLTQTALNTPHLSNGVWWYFTPGQSFGFADTSVIRQSPADYADYPGTDIHTQSRLSWHLDQPFGGFRAGRNIFLNEDSSVWHKQIYNCPGLPIYFIYNVDLYLPLIIDRSINFNVLSSQ